MDKNPCYGCDNRVLGCHSNCKLYIDWSNEREEHRNMLYKKRLEAAKEIDYIVKAKLRCKRK